MIGDCSCSCDEGILVDGASWSMEVDTGESANTSAHEQQLLELDIQQIGELQQESDIYLLTTPYSAESSATEF
ncbi:hypothetical protein Tco_0489298 [Tanacetum coccineum]